MKAKYDIIGIQYNQTRRADPYLTSRMRTLLKPQPRCTYLDIGCGTGNYTDAIYDKEARWIGVDPSAEMLRKAKAKNDQIDWRMGNAEALSLADESVDGILASLTIHHWTNLKLAFTELSRVMKPEARLVLFTALPKQMRGYWLNYYFPKMLHASIEQMPEWNRLEAAIRFGGLRIDHKENYFVQKDLQDLFLYAGKHRPELYLNPQVRQGISSFSSLANAAEVRAGLQKLEDDIYTHRIRNIIDQYENTDGDYLFIVANKPMP